MKNAWMAKALDALEDAQQRRRLRTLNGAQQRTVDIGGTTYLNFCSNNYLGLANDARIVAAASAAMARYGFGSGASRLVCGNMAVHDALEAKIAALKSQEKALMFNSGYSANSGVIPSVVGRGDIVFSDKLNHASIVDGIILSRAEFKRYPHGDMQALEEALKKAPAHGRRMIVTDTVFSMDGDVADLKTIVALAKRYQALVYVDEAHAFGVMGRHGGGLVEALGLTQDIDIQMGTLSKAAGCFGAYVVGSSALREYLINQARSFIYTTGLPPMLAAAAECAVDIIDSTEGMQLRAQVASKADYLRAGLNQMGFDTMRSATPIIPILVGDSAKAVQVSERLFEQGVFVAAIRPPTVPVAKARLRFAVTASHTQEDLDRLLSVMRSL